MENAIELRHVTKTFGRVTANRDVSLELKKGEIHYLRHLLSG